MSNTCEFCKYWRKIRDIPFGICELPKILSIWHLYWEDSKPGDDPFASNKKGYFVTTDTQSCSKWERKDES